MSRNFFFISFIQLVSSTSGPYAWAEGTSADPFGEPLGISVDQELVSPSHIKTYDQEATRLINHGLPVEKKSPIVNGIPQNEISQDKVTVIQETKQVIQDKNSNTKNRKKAGEKEKENVIPEKKEVNTDEVRALTSPLEVTPENKLSPVETLSSPFDSVTETPKQTENPFGN
jgi:hypothetical protein